MSGSGLLDNIAAIARRFDRDVLESRNGAIAQNEAFSTDRLDRARRYILENPPPPELRIQTMAAAGSLARLDASAESDLDLIVTTEENETPAVIHDALIQWREALCVAIEMQNSNPDGVFAYPVSHAQICKSAGKSDEDYGDVAKRVLILLESTWLFNEHEYWPAPEG